MQPLLFGGSPDTQAPKNFNLARTYPARSIVILIKSSLSFRVDRLFEKRDRIFTLAASDDIKSLGSEWPVSRKYEKICNCSEIPHPALRAEISQCSNWWEYGLRPAIRRDPHQGRLRAESASWVDPAEGTNTPRIVHCGKSRRTSAFHRETWPPNPYGSHI